jgi:hypothetical protein
LPNSSFKKGLGLVPQSFSSDNFDILDKEICYYIQERGRKENSGIGKLVNRFLFAILTC